MEGIEDVEYGGVFGKLKHTSELCLMLTLALVLLVLYKRRSYGSI
jgi:hypothetical protein